MDFITKLETSLKPLLNFTEGYGWILQVFIIVLATLFANYFIRKMFNRLAIKAAQSSLKFDVILVRSARKPVRFFVWIAGILVAADVVKAVSEEPIFDLIQPIREVSFTVLFAWFVVRFISHGENVVQKDGVLEKPMDATTASALGKLLRLSVMITTSLVVLQNLGVNLSAVLAFGGVGGIAVGFAAKDLLANFFGGLMIYLDQPFKVGDWIRSPDQDIEGTVEHIGWRLTCIRTFDKRPLYVPNSTFASISVENPSRMTNRRIKETVGLRYDDASKVSNIVEDVKQMLRSHPDIDQEQTLIVNLNEFSSSSIDFFIYTFTKTTNWIEYHDIKQDVMVKIIEIVEASGAEFAFPTQTLHVKHEPEMETP